MRMYIIILCLLFCSCAKKYNDSQKAIGYQKTVDKMESILKNIPRVDIEEKNDSTLKPAKAFDPNIYLSALSHIKLKPGYVLDYVILRGFMGGEPYIYARKANEKPFSTLHEYEGKLEKLNPPCGIYHNHSPYSIESQIELTDEDESYIEYVVFNIMKEQFYLWWHSNYNDKQIVFTKEKFARILDPLPYASDSLKEKISSLYLEPIVTRKDSAVDVSLPVFSHWGGLVRRHYTISKSLPHHITNVPFYLSDIDKRDYLLDYDCNIMF